MVENELSLIGNATNVNRDADSSISLKSDGTQVCEVQVV